MYLFILCVWTAIMVLSMNYLDGSNSMVNFNTSCVLLVPWLLLSVDCSYMCVYQEFVYVNMFFLLIGVSLCCFQYAVKLSVMSVINDGLLHDIWKFLIAISILSSFILVAIYLVSYEIKNVFIFILGSSIIILNISLYLELIQCWESCVNKGEGKIAYRTITDLNGQLM